MTLLPAVASQTAGAATGAGGATSGPSFTMTGGGDVAGDGLVNSYIRAHGAHALLNHIRPVLSATDLAFINLESPFSNKGWPQGWKDVVFRGDPRMIPGLAWAGVDVVTMANNHTMDYHAAALLDTIRRLKKAGVAHVGAGANSRAAHTPAYLLRHGVKVAFLGYSDILPAGYVAGAGPGIAAGRSSLSRVRSDVHRAAHRSDFVVVAWHWNQEYTTAPGWLQRSEGKAAINAGADIVFAHHPHVLQGVQAYHGGLICWSLGNLVFGGFSGSPTESMLVQATVSKHRIEATLIPVHVSSSGVPTLASGSLAHSILARVRAYSAQLGTRVVIHGTRGMVTVKR
jgi:poly-gamma-glutamate synthesis protein (capsule biosynthesis protein)